MSRGDSDLYLVDLATGAETLLTPHRPPGNFFGGFFSPDGRTVYLAPNQDRDRVALARVRLGAGRRGRARSRCSPSATTPSSTASRSAATAPPPRCLERRRASELAFLDLATGRVTPGPALPAEIVGGLNFSSDGQLLAIDLSGATRPSDVWVLDRASGSLRQVTHSPHAGVDLDALVRPELVRFPAHDGLELSGWLYRPRRRRRPAPLRAQLPRRPRGAGAPVLQHQLPGAARRAASPSSPPTCAARPASASASSTWTTARCATGRQGHQGLRRLPRRRAARRARQASASWAAPTAAT